MRSHGSGIHVIAAGLAAAVQILWACGPAVAQQGKAPVPAGGEPGARQQAPQRPAQAAPRRGSGAAGEGTTVQGTVLQKDMKANAVQIKTPQGTGWVQFPQDAPLFRFVPAKSEEIREKDVITVYGIPTVLDARSVELVTPAAPPAPAAGAGAAPAKASAFVPAPGAMAAVTGTVMSLKPLVLTVSQGMKITVATSARTRVMRRTESTLETVAVGEVVTALGDMQRPDIMQARAGWVGRQESDAAAPGGAKPAGAGRPAGQEGGRRPGGRRQGAGKPGARPGGEQPAGELPAAPPTARPEGQP